MKETIKKMIAKAEQEQDFELAEMIKDLVSRMATTINCPSNWRDISEELHNEYPKDSWIYEAMQLWDY